MFNRGEIYAKISKLVLICKYFYRVSEDVCDYIDRKNILNHYSKEMNLIHR